MTRRMGEALWIGKTRVTFLHKSGGQVVVSVLFSEEVEVDRDEVRKRKQAELS